MEGDISICNSEEVKKQGNRTRLSLFLPSEVTMSEAKTNRTNSNNEDYANKLKLEAETWGRLYEEHKQENKHMKQLMRQVKYDTKLIDYTLFDEEEIKYLNAGPDIIAFVKEAEELQNLVKIVNLQAKQMKQKCEASLESMEKACLDITSNLIKY